MEEGVLWGVMTIVGPVLLFFSMICAGIASRRRSRRQTWGLPAAGSLHQTAEHEHDVDQAIIDSPPLVPLPTRHQTRIR